MKKIMTVMASAALVLLAACVIADTSDPRVSYLGGAEHHVQVSGQRLVTAGGVPCFEATIRSLNRLADTEVYWSVEFFDKEGSQVARGVSHERKVVLRAEDQTTVQTQSSDANAVAFRIKVRT